MRKVSTLIGLMLVALAATARAQDAAPAAPAAAVAVPAPANAPAAAPRRRIHVGVSFMPMALGKLTATAAGMTSSVDSAFAMGVGLSAGYEVIPGLIVGVAPQVIYNGKPKEAPGSSGPEYDLLARIAYALTIPDVATLYAEVMPGYSIIYPSFTDTSKGLVVAFGVGAAVDITKQVFVNLGVGYQKGFQTQTAVASFKTEYVRVALGLGMKF